MHLADHVSAFARDGFTVIRGALSGTDVARLRDQLAACAATARAHGGASLAGQAGQNGGPVWQVVAPHHHVPEALAALRSPRISGVAAACLGTRRLQLLQDVLLVKPARQGGHIDWHQDHTYTGYLTPPRLLSIRIALGVEDARHGGLRVLAGSHRWPIARTDGFGALTLAADELAQVVREMGEQHVQNALRAVDLQPGDVSLHHCRTFHSSVDNQADTERLTLVAHAFDAVATLDRSRLPAGLTARFPTDDAGHLEASQFPLLRQ